jgi:hypothetical protein
VHGSESGVGLQEPRQRERRDRLPRDAHGQGAETVQRQPIVKGRRDAADGILHLTQWACNLHRTISLRFVLFTRMLLLFMQRLKLLLLSLPCVRCHIVSSSYCFFFFLTSIQKCYPEQAMSNVHLLLSLYS